MALVLHITIALASVGFTTYLYFAPTQTKLYISYALVAATLATGFYLVAVQPAHMVHACATGLIYVCIVSVGIVAARDKLALQYLRASKKSKKF